MQSPVKKSLVLATKCRYLKVISDIARQDNENHNDNPEELIRKVCNWFAAVLNNHQYSSTLIGDDYNKFLIDITEMMKKEAFSGDDIESLPFSNFVLLASNG